MNKEINAQQTKAKATDLTGLFEVSSFFIQSFRREVNQDDLKIFESVEDKVIEPEQERSLNANQIIALAKDTEGKKKRTNLTKEEIPQSGEREKGIPYWKVGDAKISNEEVLRCGLEKHTVKERFLKVPYV